MVGGGWALSPAPSATTPYGPRPKRWFKTRLSELGAKLEELRDQERDLTAQLAEPADSLDPAALAAVADQLRDTIANGEPAQTKALLRTLIKEIRVNSQNEILPTYRVVTPEVRAND